MADIQFENRTYPLKKPPQEKSSIPRYGLKLPEDITTLYTIYIGIQSHTNDPNDTLTDLESTIDNVLSPAPATTEKLRVTAGFDLPGSTIWVAYITSPQAYTSLRQTLSPLTLWTALPAASRASVGVWTESFAAPVARLETTYSTLAHRPGLAALPDTAQPAHGVAGYWGAARDRVPAAAHDRFPLPGGEEAGGGGEGKAAVVTRPETVPRGRGQRLTGSNYEHMCHIRSGQWWEACGQAEREAYEGSLQGKLMAGMEYLWDNAEETGTLGLRVLQNVGADGQARRETCGCGFFRNWSDLEKWSSRHPSHLAIYNGLMKHGKDFGEEKRFMTWHEVWIFKAGEVDFEYVNADSRTGVIKHVVLEVEEL